MSLPFLQPYFGLSNSLQTAQASAGGGGVGGWVELGRTTLGAASSTITVSSLANKRYYMVLNNEIGRNALNTDGLYRLGSGSVDTGSNYARRISIDGGADITSVSQTGGYHYYNAVLPRFDVSYIANYSTKEKLIQSCGMLQNTAGAGTAPTRQEHVAKWANTSNSLDTVSFNTGGADTFNSGCEVVVLGWDPADTHTTNFWTELASVSGTGSGTTLDSGTFTAKKYLWVQIYFNASTTFVPQFRFNGDTATNYADRYSVNGGADGTDVSSAGYYPSASTTSPQLINTFIINNSANEKLCISHVADRAAAGAANAPNRAEAVGKWANTANQITSLIFSSVSGAATLTSTSIMKVYGSN